MEVEFKPGNVVIITSPDNFVGVRLAGVLYSEKWCPDGIAVRLLAKGEPIPFVCVRVDKGDTIKKIS